MSGKDCVYFRYFGDYGMYICEHPSREHNREIYKGGCRGCKLRQGMFDGIERCPFCGCKARIIPAMGNDTIKYKWAIECTGCGAVIRRMSVSAAKIAWNNRFNGAVK